MGGVDCGDGDDHCGDGSGNFLSEVTVYTEAGFMMELPRLGTGRYSAACGVVGGVRQS